MAEPPKDLQPRPAENLPPEAKDPLVEKALATFDDTEARTKLQVLQDAGFLTAISGGISKLKGLPEAARPEPDTRAVQENAMRLAESAKSSLDRFAALSQSLGSAFSADRQTIDQILKSLAAETDPQKISRAAQEASKAYAAVVKKLEDTRKEQGAKRQNIEDFAEGNRAESLKWRDNHPDSIGNRYYMGSYTFAEHTHQASRDNRTGETVYLQQNADSVSVFNGEVEAIVTLQRSKA